MLQSMCQQLQYIYRCGGHAPEVSRAEGKPGCKTVHAEKHKHDCVSSFVLEQIAWPPLPAATDKKTAPQCTETKHAHCAVSMTQRSGGNNHKLSLIQHLMLSQNSTDKNGSCTERHTQQHNGPCRSVPLLKLAIKSPLAKWPGRCPLQQSPGLASCAGQCSCTDSHT